MRQSIANISGYGEEERRERSSVMTEMKAEQDKALALDVGCASHRGEGLGQRRRQKLCRQPQNTQQSLDTPLRARTRLQHSLKSRRLVLGRGGYLAQTRHGIVQIRRKAAGGRYTGRDRAVILSAGSGS